MTTPSPDQPPSPEPAGLTLGKRRIGRRALIIGSAATGAGLVAAGAAYEIREHTGGSGSAASGEERPGPVEQTVDLATRWRHLERRVTHAGLLAAWDFDDGSGYEFADRTDHGHPLTITGSAWNTTDSGLLSAIHRRGLRGGAAYLDGTRWLAAAPTTTLCPAVGVTLTMWVRLDRLPRSEPALLAGLGAACRLMLDAGGGLTLTVSSRGGGQRHVTAPAGSVTTGRWTQVAATVDAASGALTLYADGARIVHQGGGRLVLPLGPAELTLGTGLVGAIDETTLHRGALSAAEVHRWWLLGLPTVVTQTSATIDDARRVFTRFHGSDPIPHPMSVETLVTWRFAGTLSSSVGGPPRLQGPDQEPAFAPGPLGAAWRPGPTAAAYRLVPPGSGTLEIWWHADGPSTGSGPRRMAELTGGAGTLTLLRRGDRWQVQTRTPGGSAHSLTGTPHPDSPGRLAHVAVAWGDQPDGRHGVALLVDGVPDGFLATGDVGAGFDTVTLGGAPAAPAPGALDDARLSRRALGWGDVCPRGQTATEAAGLDLRDPLSGPEGTRPLLWRTGADSRFRGGVSWSLRRRDWVDTAPTGADPETAFALWQHDPRDLHTAYHPDAYGHGSSIEAELTFPAMLDGWAGVFVWADDPDHLLSGVSFMLNPAWRLLRIARHIGGRVDTAKTLRHDFPLRAEQAYQLTLTAGPRGLMQGFVDGINVISLRAGSDWPTRGYAGLATSDARACFANVHVTALTPATGQSRVVRTSLVRLGDGVTATSTLTPFRWHKRRGLPPWCFTSKSPEPPGNIAGADTAEPQRPIAPASWRSEDSANTDIVTLDRRVLLFLRGDPRIDELPGVARVGVLSLPADAFDGIHFHDPNRHLVGGTVISSESRAGATRPFRAGSYNLNAPSTAYIGSGRLAFFGNRSSRDAAGIRTGSHVVFATYDAESGAWEQPEPRPVPWSSRQSPALREVHGSPEVVGLRDPDHDRWQLVLLQQTGEPGRCEMVTLLLDTSGAADPVPVPHGLVHTGVARESGDSIYGFRVLFDNGIYYLHFNDGPHVPDWPDRFVLAATLDPTTGPWHVCAATAGPDAAYFQRGGPFDPDNGAIWQGAMFKTGGHYYLYYENYHSIGNVDQQYADYDAPQAGSRLGFATA